MCRPASPSQEHDSCVTMESIIKKILNVLPWGAVRIVARFYWKKKLIEASRSSAPHQAGMKLLMAKIQLCFLICYIYVKNV
uniref:Uncharacterized protein n=1 Tax=Setaria viridis TaxID=4556 RepID=A0A4U6SXB6_SETVI|nr:hypothetical protein SEVIR_9G244300v2 [Setaria viridis]